MKKIIAFSIAVIMIVTMSLPALAGDSVGTTVKYGVGTERYTLKIPETVELSVGENYYRELAVTDTCLGYNRQVAVSMASANYVLDDKAWYLVSENDTTIAYTISAGSWTDSNSSETVDANEVSATTLLENGSEDCVLRVHAGNIEGESKAIVFRTDIKPTLAGVYTDTITFTSSIFSTVIADVSDIAAPATVHTYSLQRNLLSAAAREMIEEYFASGTTFAHAYETSVNPFTPILDLGLSNSTVTSITIPVAKVLDAVDGYHTFTIYRVKYSASGSGYKDSSCILGTYTVKIPATAYGLPTAATSGLQKLIRVDLKSYNIELGTGETLGFFADSDTLCPLYFVNHSEDKAFRDDISELCPMFDGFYASIGTSSAFYESNNALLFDFTYEKIYENDEAYEAAVAEEFTAQNGKIENSMLNTDQIDDVQALITEEPLKEYWLNGAPYAPSKDVGLSNTKLTSITIPIKTVSATGDCIFTLSIVDANAIKTTANSGYIREQPIKVNAAAYGLSSGVDAYKFVTVDVSSYNIVLDEGQTVAVAKSTDTVTPLYVGDTEAPKTTKYCQENVSLKNWNYFISNAGTATSVGGDSTFLLFNFTYVKEYASVAEYLANDDFNLISTSYVYDDFDTKLATVAAALSGQKLSILGDSISTYYNITSGATAASTYNSTITNNNLWYNESMIAACGLTSHTDTYWGRFIANCNMSLCVDNAWSGSAFDGSGYVFNRAQNLHNDHTNTNPDFILVYYGINNTPTWADNNGYLPERWGDVEDLASFSTRGDKSEEEMMDAWIEALDAEAVENNYSGGSVDGGAFDTFAENYAYMIYTITKKYPNAKIVCVSLATNNHPDYADNSEVRVPIFNEAIKMVASYFDCVYVDQTKVMSKEKEETYTYTYDGIHPTVDGHELMFNAIVNTLYYYLTEEY